MNILSYNPGILPTKPAITAGECVELEVDGYPPSKDIHFSIRNPRHKLYGRFVALREAGTKAMDGRAWTHGPIRMSFELHAPSMEDGKSLLNYAAGIGDTLDGSSGSTFTYLPIVYEDDCQICDGQYVFVQSVEIRYTVKFEVIQACPTRH